MEAQHNTLVDRTGANVAWLLVNPISQYQWVIAQRQEFGRLQRNHGGNRGGGGRGKGNGGYRNMNSAGRVYARAGGGGG